jgi:hypothetical protein
LQNFFIFFRNLKIQKLKTKSATPILETCLKEQTGTAIQFKERTAVLVVENSCFATLSLIGPLN